MTNLQKLLLIEVHSIHPNNIVLPERVVNKQAYKKGGSGFRTKTNMCRRKGETMKEMEKTMCPCQTLSYLREKG